VASGSADTPEDNPVDSMIDNYKFFIGHNIAWDGNEISFKGSIYSFTILGQALDANQV